MPSRSRSRSRERHRHADRDRKDRRPDRNSGRDRSKDRSPDREDRSHMDRPDRRDRDRNTDRDRERDRGRKAERDKDRDRRDRERQDDRPRPNVKREAGSDDEAAFNSSQKWGTKSEPADASAAGSEEVEKEGPNFATSGKLLEDTNVFNGVVVKYSEPPEARKPKRQWRFYVFKGEEALPTLYVHRQSAYLIGKDRKVADLPIDHPSCSRQHAVLQYRHVHGRITPYVIDLGSSNGTYLNNQRIDAQRYYELREKDMLKFGYSSREYVLLHDSSCKDDDD